MVKAAFIEKNVLILAKWEATCDGQMEDIYGVDGFIE